jgi:NAD-dependent SIR2 family protein deacetylase
MIEPIISGAVTDATTELVKELSKLLLKRVKEKKITKDRIPRDKQLLNLIDAYREEKLVLVLGAGVSINHGLPDWNTLLQKLLINTFVSETDDNSEQKSILLAKLFTKVFSPSPLIAARYLKKFYQNDAQTTSFEDAVRNTIYEEVDLTKESELFNEIRQLCVAPGKSPTLDSIITYNYDDILEKYLSDLNVEILFKSIYSVGMNPSNGELPIYHVHGFLPQSSNLSDKNKITLSEDIYHQQYQEIYSWNNLVQINKFRDNTCILIGTSFTDPNLRRLLDIAMLQKGKSDKYHYLIRKKYDLKIVELKLLKKLDQSQDLYGDKVRANLELDETVKQLVGAMEIFEEKDALSFGVKTIWIEDYKEIPEILKSIRRQSISRQ